MLNKKSGFKVLSAVTALTLAAGASCLSGMEKENLTAGAALAGDVNGDGASKRKRYQRFEKVSGGTGRQSVRRRGR